MPVAAADVCSHLRVLAQSYRVQPTEHQAETSFKSLFFALLCLHGLRENDDFTSCPGLNCLAFSTTHPGHALRLVYTLAR